MKLQYHTKTYTMHRKIKQSMHLSMTNINYFIQNNHQRHLCCQPEHDLIIIKYLSYTILLA